MRNIFFDIDGVLIRGYHHNPQYRNLWSKNIEQDLGVCEELLQKNFFTPENLKNIITGKKDLYDAMEEFLKGIKSKTTPHEVISYWFEKDTNVNHELISFIKKLKRIEGIKVYIATNQEKHRAKHLWNSFGFNELFEDIFYSGKVGYTKASPDFFKFVEKNIDMGDEQPLFFDDTPVFVEAAIKTGWKAVEYSTIDDFKNCKEIKRLLF